MLQSCWAAFISDSQVFTFCSDREIIRTATKWRNQSYLTTLILETKAIWSICISRHTKPTPPKVTPPAIRSLKLLVGGQPGFWTVLRSQITMESSDINPMEKLQISGAKRQTENTKDPEGNAQGKDPCDHQPHKMGGEPGRVCQRKYRKIWTNFIDYI